LQEAESLFRLSWSGISRGKGAKHRDTLNAMCSLAETLSLQGKSAEAEPLYRQALEIRKQLLGEKHPAQPDQGKYAEAETLYSQALTLGTQINGKEHPETITCMANLGNMLQIMGKFSDAETRFRTKSSQNFDRSGKYGHFA